MCISLEVYTSLCPSHTFSILSKWNPQSPTTQRQRREEDDHGCLSAFVDTGSVESHHLYLARRTALEMLRDCGYGVAVTDLEQTLAQFRSLYGGNSDLERLKISFVLRDPSKKVPSFFLSFFPSIVCRRDTAA